MSILYLHNHVGCLDYVTWTIISPNNRVCFGSIAFCLLGIPLHCSTAGSYKARFRTTTYLTIIVLSNKVLNKLTCQPALQIVTNTVV